MDRGLGTVSWFLLRAFGHRDLGHFSAFANVHTLKLQNMQIYEFIPGIERYFEQFPQTLRSITLYDPCCTPQQLSHFLSLFSNLDDIEIDRTVTHTAKTTISDTDLITFFVPRLQGRLVLITLVGLRLGCTSLHGAAYGSVPWTYMGVHPVHPSCLRRVLRRWRQYNPVRWMVQLVCNSTWLHRRFKFMVNRGSQPFTAQGPPVSMNWVVGGEPGRPPSARCPRGILDHNFSCVLRSRRRSCRSRGLVTPGKQTVQDLAHDEES